MPRYVDAFVLPVPKKNLAAYKRLSTVACKVWREYGALDYRECVGDDLTPGFGVPFPNQIKCKKGETIVFSWILYKSKTHRKSVNAKVMKDPRILESMSGKMPFDPARMLTGGFEVLVEI